MDFFSNAVGRWGFDTENEGFRDTRDGTIKGRIWVSIVIYIKKIYKKDKKSLYMGLDCNIAFGSNSFQHVLWRFL